MKDSIKSLILAASCLLGFSAEAMDAPQPPKIAILAWGSLVEHQGTLNLVEGNGFKEHGQTGPGLYIDYARVSQDGRLTLVIAPGFEAKKMKTFYATFKGRSLDKALSALRKREGTTGENIGYVNLNNETYRRKDFDASNKATSVKKGTFADRYYQNNDMLKRIVTWARSKGYTAVIWTDLPPTFTKTEFTQTNLKGHLNGLDPVALRKAYCYFKITPTAIRNSTKFGNELMNHAAHRIGDVQGFTIAECHRIIFGN